MIDNIIVDHTNFFSWPHTHTTTIPSIRPMTLFQLNADNDVTNLPSHPTTYPCITTFSETIDPFSITQRH